MTYNPQIKPLQAALGLKPDGYRGPVTTAAVLEAFDAGRLVLAVPQVTPPEKMPVDEDDIPAAGDAKLATVVPQLQQVIRLASAICAVPFTVIEGIRTIERQRELVARGASKTMNSRHLTGHAVDLWPLDPATGKALPAGTPAAEARLWADLHQIAAAVKSAGAELGIAIEWGGDWKSFKDGPHFQLTWAAFPA